MPFFSSSREKRLWIYVLLVLVAIYSTLGFAGSLAGILRDRNLLTPFFFLGMLMVMATVLFHGLKKRPRGMEIVISLGILSAYLLLFTRIAVPEDAHGHLIEYSIVAIFIYEALLERKSQGRSVLYPSLLAILISTLLGLLDECIQAALPSRVFDPIDMLFNFLASLMAVSSSVGLAWARERFGKTSADGTS